jgi:hypothetical protein
LDWGISESDFWDMTLAELIRLIESKRRVQEKQLKERATFDHILGDLIGRSMARVYSSSARYPSIAEAYPTLFSQAEIEENVQAKKDELSVLRFKQFTQSFNAKFKGGEKTNNE